MQKDFVKAIRKKKQKKTHDIKATFKNGQSAIYTVNSLPLMLNDPDVVEIMDLETGELLKY